MNGSQLLPFFCIFFVPAFGRKLVATNLEDIDPSNLNKLSEAETRFFDAKVSTEIPSFMVGIGHKGGGPFCTAALISPDRVITAAHCLPKQDMNTEMQAVLGLLDLTPENVEKNLDNPNVSVIYFQYKDVKNNPRYVGDGHDMSIIKLPEKVKPIFKPILLASGPENIKDPLRGMGWGMKSCTEGSADALREANATYVEHEDCGFHVPENSKEKMCVLYTAYGKPASVGFGDSGGPLFSLSNPNEPVLLGVLATFDVLPGTEDCPDPLSPQGYCQVAPYRKFILEEAPNAKFA